MEKQKHERSLWAILNVILEALIAQIMGISPAEAADFLVEAEVHDVR